MFSNQDFREKTYKLITLGVFALSIVPVVFYIYIIFQRVPLPLDFEWGEGAGVLQIQRILEGSPLYAKPSIDFSPLVYTPFYYYVAAVLGKITGSAMLGGRLLSIFASISTAGLIGWLVYRGTNRPVVGWYAAAFYLACFPLSDGFYDLVRVDSWYVFLCIAAYSILLLSKRPAGYFAAGLLIVLSFFTKQSAVVVFFPLVAYLLIFHWKTSRLLLPVVLVGIIGILFLVNRQTDGWFSYYIIGLPEEHGLSPLSLIGFWPEDLLGKTGIAVSFGLFFFIMVGFEKYKENGEPSDVSALQANRSGLQVEIIHALFSAGAISAAWMSRSVNGGGANDVMMAYAAVALLFGLGTGKAQELSKAAGKGEYHWRMLISCILVLQFLSLFYNPFNWLPTADELQANQKLIEYISRVDKSVLIPYRSHLPQLAGKDPSIHIVNLFELTGYFKGSVQPEGQEIVNQIRKKICSQDYSMIVIDQPLRWFQYQIDIAYQPADLDLISKESHRSSLLKWQGGYERNFQPRENYSFEDCINSFDAFGD